MGWVGWHLQTWSRGRKWCGAVRCGLILSPVWRTSRIKPSGYRGTVVCAPSSRRSRRVDTARSMYLSGGCCEQSRSHCAVPLRSTQPKHRGHAIYEVPQLLGAQKAQEDARRRTVGRNGSSSLSSRLCLPRCLVWDFMSCGSDQTDRGTHTSYNCLIPGEWPRMAPYQVPTSPGQPVLAINQD